MLKDLDELKASGPDGVPADPEANSRGSCTGLKTGFQSLSTGPILLDRLIHYQHIYIYIRSSKKIYT